MEVLDTTIVNVSLPQIAGNLGATAEEIAWVSTGYILSNVVVLPITAWLASRFGRRNYLLASILIFTLASMMCGLSSSLGALVLWRIVQGAGGAALLSTAQATLREIFPPEEQAMTQSIYILGVIVAPTIGPTLGGWITDTYSWNWAFFINLPVGLAALYLVATYLKDSKFVMATGKVDWLGLGMLTVGLGSLQYALEEGNSKNWLESSTIVTLLVLAAIALPMFVWWELHPKNEVPIVNVKVMRNPQLLAGLILFITLGFGLYGGVFLFPLFAQNILRLTPTQTGLALFPGGLATAVSAFTVGRVMSHPKLKIPPIRLVVFGFLMFLISMLMLGSLTPTASIDNAFWALLIRGAGLGLLFIPINIAAFSSLKGPEIAQGSALLNLCRQLGGSFGIAILATYLTRQTSIIQQTMSRHYVLNSNYELTSRRYFIAQYLHAYKGFAPPIAAKASDSVMLQLLNGQAAAVAFNHSFLLIAGAVVVSAPTMLLLRTKKKGGAAPSAPVPVADH